MLKSVGIAIAALTIVGSGGGLTGSAAQAQETVQSMLAAQTRTQGYVCDKTLKATKDARRSKPDHEVWVLKCSNATYRVGRAPDMAVKVEVIR